MNKDLTYSEITSKAGNLRVISSQIDELLLSVKEDYARIGDDGDIWTGDAAMVAHDTFDELVAKVPAYIKSINEYADYLVNVVAKR